MSFGARPPANVPTLTEVIDLRDSGATVAETGSAAVVTSGFPNARPAWSPISNVVVGTAPQAPHRLVGDAAQAVAAAPVPPAASLPLGGAGVSEAQIAQRVLDDVQKQIDGLLDFRLREAIGPILARHSEALVRDLREELGRTMRDVVARSVAQEMAKLRQR